MQPNRCICIYTRMTESRMPELPCLCASFRRTARALTQHYEEALRPLGLRTTQLTILQALSLAGDVSQGQLGEMLAMDSTSLTRTLAIMQRESWIAVARGKDRRERRLRLSLRGEMKLKRAQPVWNEVQALLRRKLGEQAWKDLLQVTQRVADMVKLEGD